MRLSLMTLDSFIHRWLDTFLFQSSKCPVKCSVHFCSVKRSPEQSCSPQQIFSVNINNTYYLVSRRKQGCYPLPSLITTKKPKVHKHHCQANFIPAFTSVSYVQDLLCTYCMYIYYFFSSADHCTPTTNLRYFLINGQLKWQSLHFKSLFYYRPKGLYFVYYFMIRRIFDTWSIA